MYLEPAVATGDRWPPNLLLLRIHPPPDPQTQTLQTLQTLVFVPPPFLSPAARLSDRKGGVHQCEPRCRATS